MSRQGFHYKSTDDDCCKCELSGISYADPINDEVTALGCTKRCCKTSWTILGIIILTGGVVGGIIALALSG